MPNWEVYKRLQKIELKKIKLILIISYNTLDQLSCKIIWSILYLDGYLILTLECL